METLVVGAFVFLVPALWAGARAGSELKAHGRVGLTTFVLALLAYVGHAAVVAFAAWHQVWPLPSPEVPTRTIGAIVFLVGAVMYGVARQEFRSFRLTWGLETSRLVTTGIYRFSRNPQSLGAFLVLIGIAILGRSGVGVILAAIPFAASFFWLPIEERILERRFGERYLAYQKSVPRFTGWTAVARRSRAK